MSIRRKKKEERRREARRYSPAVADRVARVSAKVCRTWPVVRCLVPDSDVWRASGCGSSLIVRQKPDGTFAFAVFELQMMAGGFAIMFGDQNCASMSVIDAFLGSVTENSPPCVPGDPDLLARYVYGVRAWALERGYLMDERVSEPLLALLPAMAGTPDWWLQYLTQEDFTPPRLLEVLRSYDADELDDVPADKEIVCFTTANFDLRDPEAAVTVLNRNEPEFGADGTDDDGTQHFCFTRAYPKNHWSPLSKFGGRQLLGSMRIHGSTLTAECKVLSMTGRLVWRLKQILGDNLKFRDADWMSLQQLQAQAEQNGRKR